MKPILSIQYLRAFAALSVALFHHHWMELGKNAFPAGAAGVDLFFVISGFIMFTLTERTDESAAGKFLWRRLVRIVPLYYAVTLLTVVVAMGFPGFLSQHVDISWRHVAASLLFIPHVAAGEGSHILPTLPQGWTLNIEMFFYLLMTGALFLQRRFQLPLLSVLMLGLAWVGGAYYPQHAIANLYTNNMVVELLAGLWLGQFWAWKSLPGRKAGILMMVAGVTGFCLQQWLGIDIDALRPNIPAILIVMGALCIEADGGIFQSKTLKLLGDASYSSYLMHEMVLSCVKHLHLPYPLSVVLGGVAVTGTGVVVYLYFEKPLLACLKAIPPWHFLPQTSAPRRQSS